jgi:hypothetical protein
MTTVSRETYRRWARWLRLLAGTTAVAVAAGCAGSTFPNNPDPATNWPVVSRETSVALIDDVDLVAQVNALCEEFGEQDARCKPMTVAQLPLFLSLACKPGNIYQVMESTEMWRDTSALIRARCGLTP